MHLIPSLPARPFRHARVDEYAFTFTWHPKPFNGSYSPKRPSSGFDRFVVLITSCTHRVNTKSEPTPLPNCPSMRLMAPFHIGNGSRRFVRQLRKATRKSWNFRLSQPSSARWLCLRTVRTCSHGMVQSNVSLGNWSARSGGNQHFVFLPRLQSFGRIKLDIPGYSLGRQ